jgi:hypothetical protein
MVKLPLSQTIMIISATFLTYLGGGRTTFIWSKSWRVKLASYNWPVIDYQVIGQLI